MKKSIFIILCLQGAVLSFNVAATAALVPSIAFDFALSQFVIGKIVWIYMLSYGAAALIYGPLNRAFNTRFISFICMFLLSAGNLLAGLAADINVLYLARFLMGFFGAAIIPLALIYIGRHVEAEHRGSYIGGFFGATFSASLLGLFLSGVIHWRFIYLLPAGAGFILCVFILLLVPLPAQKRKISDFRMNYLEALGNKSVLSIFTYIFFISLFYHGVQQWLGVYFSNKFLLNQFIISMLITLTSFSGVFGEIFGGWLSDKMGRVKTIDLGIGLMIFSVFILIFKAPLFILFLVMVIWGLGWTFNHAGLSTMLTDLPRDYLNESASLNSSIRFLSGGLGAFLGGILMQRSFALGFSVFGACLLVLLVCSRSLILKNA